jgi:hypothetical protein
VEKREAIVEEIWLVLGPVEDINSQSSTEKQTYRKLFWSSVCHTENMSLDHYLTWYQKITSRQVVVQ